MMLPLGKDAALYYTGVDLTKSTACYPYQNFISGLLGCPGLASGIRCRTIWEIFFPLYRHF